MDFNDRSLLYIMITAYIDYSVENPTIFTLIKKTMRSS